MRPTARLFQFLLYAAQCAVAALFLWGNAQAAELTGRQIMDDAANRHESDHEVQTLRMVLIEADGPETERTIRQFSRKGEDGQYKYLLVFDAPAGVKGVALLTWQNKGGDDDQWSYLPAMGKTLKRIASGGRSNYFMGTDFAFEDLVGESRDDFRYDRQPDETIGTQAVHVIDAVPVGETVTSGYERRRLFVAKDTLLTVRIDYFERRTAKLIKRLTVEEAEQIPGKPQMWRPRKTLMDNFKVGHKTRMDVQERDFGEASVPTDLFEHRYILSGRHTR